MILGCKVSERGRPRERERQRERQRDKEKGRGGGGGYLCSNLLCPSVFLLSVSLPLLSPLSPPLPSPLPPSPATRLRVCHLFSCSCRDGSCITAKTPLPHLNFPAPDAHPSLSMVSSCLGPAMIWRLLALASIVRTSSTESSLAAWASNGTIGDIWSNIESFSCVNHDEYSQILRDLPPILLDTSFIPAANETQLWYGHSFLKELVLNVMAAGIANDMIERIDAMSTTSTMGRVQLCQDNVFSVQEERREDLYSGFHDTFFRARFRNGAVVYVATNYNPLQFGGCGAKKLRHLLKPRHLFGDLDKVFFMEPHPECFFEYQYAKSVEQKGWEEMRCVHLENTKREPGQVLSLEKSLVLRPFLEAHIPLLVEVVPWSGNIKRHMHEDLVFDTGKELERFKIKGGRDDTTKKWRRTKYNQGHDCLPGRLTHITQSLLQWAKSLTAADAKKAWVGKGNSAGI